MTVLTALEYVLAFVLGSVLGSFTNVLLYRLPAIAAAGIQQGATKPVSYLAMPYSFCPSCGADIKPWHNIPLVSWLMLGGRGSCCGKPIHVRYPLVELAGGLVALACFHRFGGMLAVAATVYCAFLLVLAWIDIRHYVLPDMLVMPLLWLGLLFTVFADPPSAASVILGAAGGYLFLVIISEGTAVLTGKRMVGVGDAKLFATIGAWLGWQPLPGVLVLAAASATAYGVSRQLARGSFRRMEFVPFGPHLVLSGIVFLFYRGPLTSLYLG